MNSLTSSYDCMSVRHYYFPKDVQTLLKLLTTLGQQTNIMTILYINKQMIYYIAI